MDDKRIIQKMIELFRYREVEYKKDSWKFMENGQFLEAEFARGEAAAYRVAVSELMLTLKRVKD